MDNTFSCTTISKKRFINSFTQLYSWYNGYTIVEYKNYPIRFLCNKNGSKYNIHTLKKTRTIKTNRRRKDGSFYRVKISNYKEVATIVVSTIIPKGYQIHHIDHNHDNNDPDNLLIVTPEQHVKLHKMLIEATSAFLSKNSEDKFNEYKEYVEEIRNNYPFVLVRRKNGTL